MPIDLPPPIVDAHALVQQHEQRVFRTSAFLTYAHDDARYVDEVNSILKVLDVQTFIDKEILTVGRIDDQIIASLKQVEYQIIFCTEASNNSEYCRKEVDFSAGRRVKQIPIFVDPIEKMDWFHFHLSKQYAVIVSGIEDREAATFAIAKQLARLMQLDFGLYQPPK
ncbi:hypothetical protein HAD_13629 [Hyphomonas adhaerens MHS-3]|uniref:TIR domain-containing protein n=1 Tax=Hyphomonas adhaerens MHS-3 TaxID=1280949 RepID=A0A069E1L5_9PROT|nr:toll/interleukin-1 receptor domain-containing protein [Hyphomonas adhaerens]KCZ83646.1 hypothetical protein HAD_13629 [Hyphomonas adhaerens MHS-3]